MNIVLLTHPAYLGLVSQAHFARFLAEGLRTRGHRVEIRAPRPTLYQRLAPASIAKWAGYLDQYLLFPRDLRERMRHDPPDTLYVVCDQALGPWLAQVSARPHVVHCHDLLALRSALGEIPENPTSFTGRIYQRFIRRGFRRARHFIAISEKSRTELLRLGAIRPVTAEVVYNGLNYPYRRLDLNATRGILQAAGLDAGERGYLLHVGGGQWYKNTVGVVHLYASHARRELQRGGVPPPLWMVSPPPDASVRAAMAHVPVQAQIRFLSGLSHQTLEAMYSGALALLFPSHAEGFGWPILEAMACGCPVLTTNEAPMTEVGGAVASYVPRLRRADDMQAWADGAAALLADVLSRSPEQRDRARDAGMAWVRRFSSDAAIDAYLSIYQRVLALEHAPARLDWRPVNEA